MLLSEGTELASVTADWVPVFSRDGGAAGVCIDLVGVPRVAREAGL